MNSPSVAKEMLSVRIPKDLNNRLGEHVKAIGVSKAGYILMLLATALEKKPDPAA